MGDDAKSGQKWGVALVSYLDSFPQGFRKRPFPQTTLSLTSGWLAPLLLPLTYGVVIWLLAHLRRYLLVISSPAALSFGY